MKNNWRGPGQVSSCDVSLKAFAQIFKTLGCTEAYNIDGGGSSTMYFMGQVVKNQQRGAYSVRWLVTGAARPY